jgi:hypothetical protein
VRFKVTMSEKTWFRPRKHNCACPDIEEGEERIKIDKRKNIKREISERKRKRNQMIVLLRHLYFFSGSHNSTETDFFLLTWSEVISVIKNSHQFHTLHRIIIPLSVIHVSSNAVNITN